MRHIDCSRCKLFCVFNYENTGHVFGIAINSNRVTRTQIVCELALDSPEWKKRQKKEITERNKASVISFRSPNFTALRGSLTWQDV